MHEGNDSIGICPICDNEITREVIDRKGISASTIQNLSTHIEAGILDNVLVIAEIGLRNLGQEKLSLDLQQKEYLESTRQVLFTVIDEMKKHQAEFIKGIASQDETARKQSIDEYIRKQNFSTEQYKSIITEKMEHVRKVEEDRFREYAELNKTLKELQNKLYGTTIGTAGEVITILDLKRVCPIDEFSEVRSFKHGTDIVGEVIEHGQRCGRISISVKYQQKWDSDFIIQLTRNLEQDNSKWGLLVTRAFPREALDDRIWTTRDKEGNLILMVKPEYAPLAYYAARQIVIHWASIERIIAQEKNTVEERERMLNTVIEWLNGDRFSTTFHQIAASIDTSKQISDGLLALQTYLNDRARKLRQQSDEMRISLEQVTYALEDLKNLIQKSGALGGQEEKSLTATQSAERGDI